MNFFIRTDGFSFTILPDHQHPIAAPSDHGANVKLKDVNMMFAGSCCGLKLRTCSAEKKTFFSKIDVDTVESDPSCVSWK